MATLVALAIIATLIVCLSVFALILYDAHVTRTGNMANSSSTGNRQDNHTSSNTTAPEAAAPSQGTMSIADAKATAEMLAHGMSAVYNPPSQPSSRFEFPNGNTREEWRCADTGMSDKFEELFFKMVDLTAQSEGMSRPSKAECYVQHSSIDLGQPGGRRVSMIIFYPSGTPYSLHDDINYPEFWVLFFPNAEVELILTKPGTNPLTTCVMQLSSMKDEGCDGNAIQDFPNE